MIGSVLTRAGEVAHGLFIGLLIHFFGLGGLFCLSTFEMVFWGGNLSGYLMASLGVTQALYMIPFYRMSARNGSTREFLTGLLLTSAAMLCLNVALLLSLASL